MKLIRVVLVLGTVAMLFFPREAAATEFASPKSYPVGTNPTAVAIGDFNGDGKPDIAVVNSGSDNVSILLGNGDGTFQPARNFDVGNSMTGIFAGDFNGDGKLDVAVFLPGNFGNSVHGEVRILLGNGDGTFQAPVVTGLTLEATVLAVSDFNSDKKADLVLSNFDPNTQTSTLEIFLGKGDGTFQAPRQIPASGLNGTAFAVADFNKDGKPDLAVAISGGAQVLLGKGDGTFQLGESVAVSGGVPVQSMLTADFNGDGNLDLLVDASTVVCVKPPNNPFAPLSCTAKGTTGVFPGLGNGTFAREVSSAPRCFALGDFNSDAKTDCVLDNSFEIVLGRGDGTFSASAIPITANPSGTVAFASDLNGDKLDDLVILDSSDNAILVLLNSSPTSGADLGIVSAGSGGRVGQGLNLTYFAELLNEGPKGAANVTFTDTLPSSVTFVSATSTTGSCIQSNLVVTCSIASLADAADAQITIVVTPTTTGTITNTMDVSATEPDLALANNSATQTDTVVPVYTLTVSKTGSGSGTVQGGGGGVGRLKISCGSTCSATFLSGATPGLIEFADSGSFFQSWGGACSGSSACSLTMDSDKTVTATFILEPLLSVKFAGGGAGSVTASDGSLSCTNTGGPCSSQYAPGSSVSLTAATSAGSTFAGWSGACTGMDPNTCSITLNASQSVTATFNPPPSFTLNPSSTNLTVTRGGQASETLSLAAQGGFSGTIALSCSVSGLSSGLTCGVSPKTATAGGSSILTVSAAGLSTALAWPSLDGTPTLRAAWRPFALSFALIGCILAATFDKKRRRSNTLCILALGAATLLAACGGGHAAPASQSFSVTVTGTSGNITKSVLVVVTVD